MNPDEATDSMAVLAGALVNYLHRPNTERFNAIHSLMAVLLIENHSPAARSVYDAVRQSPLEYDPPVGRSNGGNVSRVSRGSMAR